MNKTEQDRALSLLREQNARGVTTRQLGAQIGMAPSTVSRWLQGDRGPTGKGLNRLLAWAERSMQSDQRHPAPPPSHVAELMAIAQRETAGNLVRLSRIHGYAEAVLEMLESVTERQRRVVGSLAPWAGVEEDAEVKRLRAELDATSEQAEQATFDAETTPPASAAPRRKAKGR
jgi:transcriptional regulator with XRE-family HTH domain